MDNVLNIVGDNSGIQIQFSDSFQQLSQEEGTAVITACIEALSNVIYDFPLLTIVRCSEDLYIKPYSAYKILSLSSQSKLMHESSLFMSEISEKLNYQIFETSERIQ